MGGMVIDRALVERIERQCVGIPAAIQHWLLSHPDDPVRVVELAGGWITQGVQGAYWGGGGFGLGFEGPLSEQDYRALLDMAAVVGPRFRVVVSPYCDISLPRRLIAEGFALEGMRTVLVRGAPSKSEFADLARPVAGLEVRRIDVATEIGLYADTAARAWFAGSEPREADLRMSRIANSVPTARLFVATVDGVPAGCARIDLSGGIGYFLGGSVIPEFRNRGIHQALLLARMKCAAEEGCDLLNIASLAGAATDRNAQRLGFQVAYTSLELLRGPI